MAQVYAADRCHALMFGSSAMASLAREGRVRALAVMQPARSPLLPDAVPAHGAGLGQVTIRAWGGSVRACQDSASNHRASEPGDQRRIAAQGIARSVRRGRRRSRGHVARAARRACQGSAGSLGARNARCWYRTHLTGNRFAVGRVPIRSGAPCARPAGRRVDVARRGFTRL